MQTITRLTDVLYVNPNPDVSGIFRRAMEKVNSATFPLPRARKRSAATPSPNLRLKKRTH